MSKSSTVCKQCGLSVQRLGTNRSDSTAGTSFCTNASGEGKLKVGLTGTTRQYAGCIAPPVVALRISLGSDLLLLKYTHTRRTAAIPTPRESEASVVHCPVARGKRVQRTIIKNHSIKKELNIRWYLVLPTVRDTLFMLKKLPLLYLARTSWEFISSPKPEALAEEECCIR